MGESAAKTVREIEETRARLESNIAELERRLPSPVVLTRRLAGVATGGGVGGTLFWLFVRRMRRKRRAKPSTAVLTVPPPQPVVQRDGWGPLLGAAAIGLNVVVLMRLRKLAESGQATKGQSSR